MQEGEIAPGFTLTNLNGESIDALDQSQEYIFVNFWATWCPPCIEEMPDLQAFQDKYPELIKIIGVNGTDSETSVEKVREFVEDGSYSFQVLLDKENAVYDHYSIINMPTSFIIRTSDQKIIKRKNGAVSLEQMEGMFEEVTL